MKYNFWYNRCQYHRAAGLFQPLAKPEFRDVIDPEAFKIYMQKAVEDGRLQKHGGADRYEIVDEIPETSVGKLDYKLMRQERCQSGP